MKTRSRKMFELCAMVSLGALLPWPMLVFLSFFAFDAPGSEDNVVLLTFAWALWVYPLVAIVGAGTGWLLARKGKSSPACMAAAAPLGYIAAWIAAAALTCLL